MREESDEKTIAIKWCLDLERTQLKGKNIYFLRFLEKIERTAMSMQTGYIPSEAN